MTLTRLRAGALAALALLFASLPAFAQLTPVFQSGTLTRARDLPMMTREGQIQDAAAQGVLGDANGRGVNPFAITDSNALGICTHTAPTGSSHHSLCLGHDANGAAIMTIDGSSYSLPSGGGGGGTGTVTSVGIGGPGGIFSTSGVVTGAGILSFSVAGTAGGIPYFSSTSQLSTSGLLTANMPVIGGGPTAAPTVGTVTGTGTQFVVSNAPTLVAPALGTPSSVTLTNGTGLPISTGVSGLAVGVATWLGIPSSANLAAALTDETGSGAAVFATSPTLITPALGTIASGNLSAGTVTATGGTTNSALAGRLGNMLDFVKDFGADPTGVADACALLATITTTRPIHWPTGKYWCGSNQTITTNLNIWADGAGEYNQAATVPDASGIQGTWLYRTTNVGLTITPASGGGYVGGGIRNLALAETQPAVISRTGYTGTSGSAVLAVASTTGLSAGMGVSDITNAAYIPPGSTILSIVANTSVTISNNLTHNLANTDTIHFWKPTVYVPWLTLHDNQGQVDITGLYCYGVYRCISNDGTSNGRMRVDHLRGQSFLHMIELDSAFDSVWIYDSRDWCYWSCDAAVYNWTITNGIPLYMGYANGGPEIVNFFAIGKKACLNTYQSTGEFLARIVNFYCDFSKYGIWNTSSRGTNLQISNALLNGGGYAAGTTAESVAIQDDGNGASGSNAVIYVDSILCGGMSVACINGTNTTLGSKINVGNLQVNNVSGTATVKAVSATGPYYFSVGGIQNAGFVPSTFYSTNNAVISGLSLSDGQVSGTAPQGFFRFDNTGTETTIFSQNKSSDTGSATCAGIYSATNIAANYAGVRTCNDNTASLLFGAAVTSPAITHAGGGLTIGTVSSGLWNGTTIGLAYGGTANDLSSNTDGVAVAVPTNAALKLLVPGTITLVQREGFYSARDGGDMLYRFDNNACSLNSGDGDDGSQVKSVNSKCWLWVPNRHKVIPKVFGAKGDVQNLTRTTSITSGAAILTTSASTFTSADVGKYIVVPGAGAAGVALSTTIITYTSATQVTLNNNAGTTLTAASKILTFGTADQAAILAWSTALAGQTGYLGPYLYGFASSMTLPPSGTASFTIEGVSGPVDHNVNCTYGFAALARNLDGVILSTSQSQIRNACITMGASAGLNSSGSAITMVSGQMQLLDSVGIANPFRGVELAGNTNGIRRSAITQSGDGVGGGGGVRVGHSTTVASTIGPFIEDTVIETMNANSSPGPGQYNVQVEDAGGMIMHGNTPIGGNYGLMIVPGANQTVTGIFKDSLADTYSIAGVYMVPASATGAIAQVFFEGAQAGGNSTNTACGASSGCGFGFYIANPNAATYLRGITFTNTKSYANGKQGYYINGGSALKDVTLNGWRACGNGVFTAAPGFELGNDVTHITLNSGRAATNCDAVLSGSQTVGVRIRGTGNDDITMIGNDLQGNTNPVDIALAGTVSVVMRNNIGIEDDQAAMDVSGAPVGVNGVQPVQTVAGNPTLTRVNGNYWGSLTQAWIGQATYNTGGTNPGSMCNAVTAPQVIATYLRASTCWSLK